MKTLIILAIVTIILAIPGCLSEKSGIRSNTSIVNPNGDSELALLMRKMYDEAQVYKNKLADNHHFQFTYQVQDIFTAQATDPSKPISKEYQQMGRAFVQSLEALHLAEQQDKKSHFQGMILTCVACHEKVCRGPLEKIQKLYLEEIAL
ncbi:MAG TPA: hypothetical protein PKC30_13080 [Saprospiraceae bacterium]|nr:hypothetical protein [Saprospiraceae bacterium]